MSELARLLEDDISYKKAMQLNRHQLEKLQRQLADTSTELEQSQAKCMQLSNEYLNLQKKYQNTFTEQTKGSNSLMSQIQDLKDLLEEKQRQIENFQLKMIPNLDQDMIRVKLISEMEGPYQEVVDRKDKQIETLTKRLSELQRRYDILEMTHQTKLTEANKELQHCKNIYQAENQKLVQQIAKIVEKQSGRNTSKDTMHTQRKEVEQLRAMVDLQLHNEEDSRKEILALKGEREDLLGQISSLKENLALKVHYSEQNNSIKNLKLTCDRLEDEAGRSKQEHARLLKTIKGLQKQLQQAEDDARRHQQELKRKYQAEFESNQEQLRTLKEDVRRHRHEQERQEVQYQQTCSKLKSVGRELEHQKTECIQLQAKFKAANQTEVHFQPRPQIISNISNITKPAEQESAAVVKELEQKNHKLKLKLDEANRKIVELIKQKASSGQQNDSSRQRATSHRVDNLKMVKQQNALLLEYRDTAFSPIVQPTIYKYSSHVVKT